MTISFPKVAALLSFAGLLTFYVTYKSGGFSSASAGAAMSISNEFDEEVDTNDPQVIIPSTKSGRIISDDVIPSTKSAPVFNDVILYPSDTAAPQKGKGKKSGKNWKGKKKQEPVKIEPNIIPSTKSGKMFVPEDMNKNI